MRDNTVLIKSKDGRQAGRRAGSLSACVSRRRPGAASCRLERWQAYMAYAWAMPPPPHHTHKGVHIQRHSKAHAPGQQEVNMGMGSSWSG